MRRILNFLSGILLGSFVGATIALLLTPSSGQDIRHNIQNRYIEIRDEIQSAAETRRTELEKQLEALRQPTKPTP
jgi:gas vesicle protein